LHFSLQKSIIDHILRNVSSLAIIRILGSKWDQKKKHTDYDVAGIPNVRDNRIRVCVLVKKFSCSLQQVVSLLEVALCNTDIQIFWNLHKPLRQLRFRNKVICIFKCYRGQMINLVTVHHVCRSHLCGLCKQKAIYKTTNGLVHNQWRWLTSKRYLISLHIMNQTLWYLSHFSSFHPGKWYDSTIKQVNITYFISQLTIQYHLTISNLALYNLCRWYIFK